MCIVNLYAYKFTEQHFNMGPWGDRFKAPKEEVDRRRKHIVKKDNGKIDKLFCVLRHISNIPAM